MRVIAASLVAALGAVLTPSQIPSDACSMQDTCSLDVDVAEVTTALRGKPASENEKIYWEARKELVDLKTQMQKVSAKAYKANLALLTTPQVNGTQLSEMTTKAEKDTLVVFFAPWCPHCQQYVLHDKNGDPTKAPLDVFRGELEADGSLKHLDVVSYDTAAHGREIPSGFNVQYIPTVYMAAKDGRKTPYQGNPGDKDKMRAFIKLAGSWH
mmetsp:Transcript_50980/g.116052  ORF Transcript_50980/g.116052 Transcript_50980/m.116052 type:complete len:212 (+) Transcript_50980:74-709(+)|eukprot:CAMPEP_0204311404 /NCGR_PEP_ID=MMETSP0469-20131031/2316_1 /ASSEMBLY_ACC=CAM_ASM_000384 /TAXON_ID=2969 /ORGANISM="Oxyrrhis marina" /LENGTH=211 /DNA_ID=CAMNT_0051291349 /DNA_START=74 /DNA_END=709 /DNA_ORIENTATION=-